MRPPILLLLGLLVALWSCVVGHRTHAKRTLWDMRDHAEFLHERLADRPAGEAGQVRDLLDSLGAHDTPALDAWKTPLLYRVESDRRLVLISLGSDRRPGPITEKSSLPDDYSRDIVVSWGASGFEVWHASDGAHGRQADRSRPSPGPG